MKTLVKLPLLKSVTPQACSCRQPSLINAVTIGNTVSLGQWGQRIYVGCPSSPFRRDRRTFSTVTKLTFGDSFSSLPPVSGRHTGMTGAVYYDCFCLGPEDLYSGVQACRASILRLSHLSSPDPLKFIKCILSISIWFNKIFMYI